MSITVLSNLSKNKKKQRKKNAPPSFYILNVPKTKKQIQRTTKIKFSYESCFCQSIRLSLNENE